MFRERALKVVLLLVGLFFAAFAYIIFEPQTSKVMQMFLLCHLGCFSAAFRS